MYSQAIEKNPTSTVYYTNRAFAHIKLEEYGSAIIDATRAIDIDPKWVKVCSHCTIRRCSAAEDKHVSTSQRHLTLKLCRMVGTQVGLRHFVGACLMSALRIGVLLVCAKLRLATLHRSYAACSRHATACDKVWGLLGRSKPAFVVVRDTTGEQMQTWPCPSSKRR